MSHSTQYRSFWGSIAFPVNAHTHNNRTEFDLYSNGTEYSTFAENSDMEQKTILI